MSMNGKSYAAICEKAYAERPRYFPRQPITAGDMTLEQDYFRQKMRRHNRLLHGWGVVCGAQVCVVMREDGTTEPWKAIVKSGYILGPYGDEIMIDCDRCFDLRTRCLSGMAGEKCEERVDPWCSEHYVRPERSGDLYVAVRYKEVMTRPVKVHPAGCGCEETQCEYSRWRDGYEICVLDKCPESHQNPPDLNIGRRGTLRDCPECPSEPWVVLAKVVVDSNGVVETIDNCACRRIVISLAGLWQTCESMRAEEVQEAEVEAGGRAEIVVSGSFPSRVIAGVNVAGVSVVETRWEERAVTVVLDVAASAQPGEYALTLRSERGSMLTIPRAVRIKESGGDGPDTGGGARPRAKRTR
jgi:hypothetical protein